MEQDNLFPTLDENEAVDDRPTNSSENILVYSDMKFLKGFNWAIPLAYSDAIASCQFEEGDIFYDTPKAYNQWNKALLSINYSIQVKSKPEVIFTEVNEHTKSVISVFEKNWNSTVDIEITDYKQNFHKKQISTTQGRLFTFLWHTNFAVLDINSNAPKLPILVGKAKLGAISNILSHFKKLIGDNIEKPNLFIMFYDPTNDTTASKFRDIYSSLSSDFSVNSDESTPKECNLPNADMLFPTITLKYIIIDSGKTEAIRDVIKEVLWPKRDSQKALKTVHSVLTRNRSSSANPFKLSRHGTFYSYKDKQQNNSSIKTHSFARHNTFFRYRLAQDKITRKPELPKSINAYLNLLFTDCPNHLFIDSDFHVSGLDTKINVHIIHNIEHELITIAKKSKDFNDYKQRHENIEKYMLDNDPSTIACEIPVWIEAGEFKDYYEVFKTEKALTGHIDILRYENNGQIGVWDYKPKAKKEKKAKTQVFLYAFMLAVRTGRKLEDFVCGYFDETDVFVFNPSDVKTFEL